MGGNRQYKDTVFTDLFYSDQDAERNLLSLYNALYGTDFKDEGAVEKVRLDDVIFMKMKNDLAAVIGGKRLFLCEHQSTINKNMPLRMLMYAGREYEKLIKTELRYHKKLELIPTPQFVTFYNGSAPYPLESELRLTDAFKDKEAWYTSAGFSFYPKEEDMRYPGTVPMKMDFIDRDTVERAVSREG